MKSRNYRYSDIASFEDLRLEKERLAFRMKLNESKLNLDVHTIVRVLSFPNIFSLFISDVILPRISQLLGIILSRFEKKPAAEEGEKAEDTAAQD